MARSSKNILIFSIYFTIEKLASDLVQKIFLIVIFLLLFYYILPEQFALLVFFCRREVALKILTSKGRDPGTYLLREHSLKHNYLVLSLIKDDDTFTHVEISQQLEGENLVYNIDDKRIFKDLNELQDHYKNEKNRVIF